MEKHKAWWITELESEGINAKGLNLHMQHSFQLSKQLNCSWLFGLNIFHIKKSCKSCFFDLPEAEFSNSLNLWKKYKQHANKAC